MSWLSETPSNPGQVYTVRVMEAVVLPPRHEWVCVHEHMTDIGSGEQETWNQVPWCMSKAISTLASGFRKLPKRVVLQPSCLYKDPGCAHLTAVQQGEALMLRECSESRKDRGGSRTCLTTKYKSPAAQMAGLSSPSTYRLLFREGHVLSLLF